ncbi:hypothetical protein PFISCL1PPCAC_10928, partial [Pristionchus fissidentatus]
SCSDYNEIKDLEYTNCSLDSIQDPCTKLRDLHIAWNFFSSPLVISIIVLSVLALIFNLIYTILIHIIWVREKFRGHKRTAFVANRSITTLFTIILLYTGLILWQTRGFGYVTTSVLLVIAGCDYMWIGNNFFTVTVLMFIAVMQPIFYATKLKFRHCLYLGWGLSTISTTAGSESIFPCPVETCQYPFAISILILLSGAYLLMFIA